MEKMCIHVTNNVGTVMLAKLFVVVLAIAAVRSYEAQVELEGAKGYSVTPLTTKQQSLLHTLERTLQGVDFIQYAHVGGREARVVVLKESQVIFESLLMFSGIPFEVYMEDVITSAEKEIMENEMARMRFMARSDSKIGFTAYHRHAEMNDYLDELAAKYPNRVQVRNYGNSVEGRLIKAILISTTGGADASKPVFVADAGLHAREWIAPAQALYMIKKLVEDITESDLVNDMDWIIFPLLNPDGYEFSHTNSRMWRKTRNINPGSACLGVCGNRNFDFKWMESGASNNPCSDIFAGSQPFSEPETRYLRDAVIEFKSRAKVYVAIHSYGSYFLYPFGYNGQPTPDNAEIHAVATKVADAINESSLPGSRKYLVGNSGTLLNYLAAGASDDWTYAVGNIKLSYTLELPGGGSLGFDLPPSRIEQVVKETWEGMVALARYAIQQNKITAY